MTTSANILVVDDNKDNSDLLCRILSRQGFNVKSASNGSEALQYIQNEEFDCILLDIMMPVMDGIQTLEHLKSNEKFRHIPIIVISAIDDIENVVKCIELGAEDYLFKPVNKVILNARVSASLEKKQLRDKEIAYAMHVKRELELGRQIQRDFLPENLPQPQGWEINIFFEPAFEVAGDFYDAFMIGQDKLCILIADVCGKGVGAALFMSLVRSLIRAYCEQLENSYSKIHDAIFQTNKYLTKHHRFKKNYLFTTAFFGVLDIKKGLLEYITAGHYPPIIFSKSRKITFLDLCGPALGIVENPDYKIKKASLEKGDLLFAYTDGVIEAKNYKEELFSEKRLLECFTQNIIGSSELLKKIEQNVKQFTNNIQQSDDITMMAIKRLE